MPTMPAAPVSGPGRDYATAASRLLLVLATTIFFASLAGILSRPNGFLAAFWPANAILAVILLRVAAPMRFPALIGALLGYQAAGYATGDVSWVAIQLTAANMVSAVTFTFAYLSFCEEQMSIGRPRAILALVGASVLAAAAAGVAGAPILAEISHASYFDAWRTWFGSEIMSYLVLVPGLLALGWPLRRPRLADIRRLTASATLLPALAVVATLAVSVVAVEPIAIVFPVPALIWAALVLPLPATCLLVMLFSSVTMFAVKLGLYDFGTGGLSDPLISSVHLGVAMIALAPVLVAAVTADRRRQFSELEKAARFDALTGALNRGAFMAEGEAMVTAQRRAHAPMAGLLLDVDHFKRINDLHGHAAGDLALTAMAAVIRKTIRGGDLFGRLGGEEFALLLPDADLDAAALVANRICRQIERLQTPIADGTILTMTVSIGVVASVETTVELSEVLSLADRAMYEAKRAGRNQVQRRDLDAMHYDEDSDHGGNRPVSGSQLQADSGHHSV
ncbi:sensor domain-containing diguanylate cyclase [Devosia sp. 63-57]|uniref:GGDEF domain-containing protein n=1 Tax=Devosia sp. 63-57 TaxID=1895751 RepID=UPI00086B0476|nr:sensor domain-containing diguanylate cyclase [Devosia sp. 63-57]ODT49888.1 MAG: hypothetical protein ABS74_06785 [Pelagibacterium sp. SCN 63-126]ODU85907.1 MAG: hypothetical protein ABT14_11035 [Pelagibacterium sp. SCN 63-17]OJX45264.1 MAG: hypothetical protein BGO80_05435 [Devosia sp. 63-57]